MRVRAQSALDQFTSPGGGWGGGGGGGGGVGGGVVKEGGREETSIWILDQTLFIHDSNVMKVRRAKVRRG